MKKLLLLAMLAIPTVASANFVEDCKTAYVMSDVGYKINEYIGNPGDFEQAGKPFTSRCECIVQKVTDDSELVLFYIEYNGRITGVNPSKKMQVARMVKGCESSVSKDERTAFVEKRKVQISSCLTDFIDTYKAAKADKRYAKEDVLHLQKTDQWADDLTEEKFAGRDIAIKATRACY